MIGIVVCCLANLASSLIEAAEGVLGSQPQLIAVNFPAGQCEETLTDTIVEAIANSGAERALILTDLYGASPANAAAAALPRLSLSMEATVLTGVNLPSVLEAARQANSAESLCALSERVRAAAQAGIRSITNRAGAASGNGA